MKWHDGILSWQWGGTLYLSVPFTWLLPEARARAAEHRRRAKHRVRAGGPAIELMPGYMADVADVRTALELPALSLHNPFACRTSRGCDRRCSWCINAERPLELLPDFEPRPLVCDDNLLGCPWPHVERAVEKLARLPYVDFNQGLDARLFTREAAELLRHLPRVKVRFGWDTAGQEPAVLAAIAQARAAGLTDLSCYVLVGYPAGHDTPEYARYRCETLRDAGVLPYVQRFQPVRLMPAQGIELAHLLEKDSYVAPAWTGHELHRFARYWNRQVRLKKVPYEEFYPDLQVPLFR